MIYYFGIDNVICKTNETDYENSEPNYKRIAFINNLFDNGNIIYYNSQREHKTKNCCSLLLHQQLKDWGCKYTQIKLNMLSYDKFVDSQTNDPSVFFPK
tara:strand:+ start:55 stop:351 length:297 start_codon:yes stop_codon:yes gene_type:complete